jgi:hypothetical protein
MIERVVLLHSVWSPQRSKEFVLNNMFHEAYSIDVLSQTMIYEWFRPFKDGRT